MKSDVLKGLLLIVIITTLVILAWIGLSIYHQITTSTISSQTAVQIIPINPNLNLKAVESIDQREKIPVNLQEEIKISPTPTITEDKNGQKTKTISPTPSGEE